MHAYSEDQYEAALRGYALLQGGAADAEPSGLRHTTWVRNRLATADRAGLTWTDLSLEDRISIVAMAIGYFVPHTANENLHRVTYGYEMLCRTGTLTAPLKMAA